MGKRKVKNQEKPESLVLPSTNNVLRSATKLLAAKKILVQCNSSKERVCRVLGELKSERGYARVMCFGYSLEFLVRYASRYSLELHKEPD